MFLKNPLPTVFGFIVLGSVLVAACNNENQNNNATPEAVPIESVTTSLPNAKGVELVEQNCVSCHSLEYIKMQPAMSHKAWEKIVTKMIKTFNAPITDSTKAKEIVDYLYAIKGNGK